MRDPYKKDKLSVREKCKLLDVNRSSIYYTNRPKADRLIASKIAQIWSEDQSKGYRMITQDLREYHKMQINGKRVRRVMKSMKIKGITPKRNLSKNDKPTYKYPYLLKNLLVNRANMVWATDITYVKLPTGYMYIIAIIDVHSRCVLAEEISNDLTTEPCIRCLEKCIKQYGTPEILNSDQGVQFTSKDWIEKLQAYNIKISMDGKGRWADNIWIERFWKTIKYCSIFMYGVETVAELKARVTEFIKYYNERRLHSALGYKTPMSVYNHCIATNTNSLALFCDINDHKIRLKLAKARRDKIILKQERQRIKYAA